MPLFFLRTFVYCLFLILGACASTAKRSNPPSVEVSSTTKNASESGQSAESSKDEKDEIDVDVDQDEESIQTGAGEGKEASDEDENDETPILPVPAKPAQPEKARVPFEFNQKVADWIQYFSQKDRERFQRYLDRGEPYREVIENILEENNVPADLYYLGLIESGFDFRAKSHAKAVGVWQFMRSTGKLYGLNVDAYLDERKDPIRATEAAAKHLRDLFHEFKSWNLALSAYNAGVGRIRSAIRRGGTHDFWELVTRQVLPRETMEYVPKFLAARYIGEHPDLFAFYVNEEKKYPNVELVRVPSPVTFEKIEKVCSLPAGTLAFVNPQYLKNFTHPAKRVDEIWVPEIYQKTVTAHFAALQNYRFRLKLEKEPRVATRVAKVLWYRVRAGDTLRQIARKRGLSVAYLKRVNGLKTAKLSVGQQLKLSATSYQQKKVHPRRVKKRR